MSELSGWEQYAIAQRQRDQARAQHTEQDDPAGDRHDIVDRLMAENARLRAVAEAARRYVAEAKAHQDLDSWRDLRAALRELEGMM